MINQLLLLPLIEQNVDLQFITYDSLAHIIKDLQNLIFRIGGAGGSLDRGEFFGGGLDG